MRSCPTCSDLFADGLQYCPCDGSILSQSDPLVGELLQGQFKLLALAGQGACGDVYRAHQIGVDRQVAVKVLHPSAARSPEFCARFTREARAAAHLDHPNIITVYNVGHTASGLPFMAMEWVQGSPLGCEGGRGPLPHSEVIAIGKQIASALVAAHAAGVIHRDLKPDNVMLMRRQGKPVIKMLDFGIAKILENNSIGQDDGELTRQGVVYGTPQYLSPEQASGQPVQERSDLYTLGVMLYEQLAGALPFESQGMALLVDHLSTPAPDLCERVPGIQPELAELVAQLLAKDLDARPASAAVVLERLEALERAPRPHRAERRTRPFLRAPEASRDFSLPAPVDRRANRRARVSLASAILVLLFLALSSNRIDLQGADARQTGEARGEASDTGGAGQPVPARNAISGPQRALMVAAEGYALRVLMPEDLEAEKEEPMAIEVWAPDGSPLRHPNLVLVFTDAQGQEQGVSVPMSGTLGRYELQRSFAEPGSYAVQVLPEESQVDLRVHFEVSEPAEPNS